jgi:hypothetical protein
MGLTFQQLGGVGGAAADPRLQLGQLAGQGGDLGADFPGFRPQASVQWKRSSSRAAPTADRVHHRPIPYFYTWSLCPTQLAQH